MARLLAEGHIDELEDAAIVKFELSRTALSNVLAQLSCLRYAVTEQLRAKVSTQTLDIRLDAALSAADRARLGAKGSGLVLELSLTELEVWLAFLASCYWHEYAPVDHIDLSVFDEGGKEYMIVLAVETAIDLRSPDETRRALGLDGK